MDIYETKTLNKALTLQIELYEFALGCIKEIFNQEDHIFALAVFEDMYDSFSEMGCLLQIEHIKNKVAKNRKIIDEMRVEQNELDR